MKNKQNKIKRLLRRRKMSHGEKYDLYSKHGSNFTKMKATLDGNQRHHFMTLYLCIRMVTFNQDDHLISRTFDSRDK